MDSPCTLSTKKGGLVIGCGKATAPKPLYTMGAFRSRDVESSAVIFCQGQVGPDAKRQVGLQTRQFQLEDWERGVHCKLYIAYKRPSKRNERVVAGLCLGNGVCGLVPAGDDER